MPESFLATAHAPLSVASVPHPFNHLRGASSFCLGGRLGTEPRRRTPDAFHAPLDNSLHQVDHLSEAMARFPARAHLPSCIYLEGDGGVEHERHRLQRAIEAPASSEERVRRERELDVRKMPDDEETVLNDGRIIEIDEIESQDDDVDEESRQGDIEGRETKPDRDALGAGFRRGGLHSRDSCPW